MWKVKIEKTETYDRFNFSFDSMRELADFVEIFHRFGDVKDLEINIRWEDEEKEEEKGGEEE